MRDEIGTDGSTSTATVESRWRWPPLAMVGLLAGTAIYLNVAPALDVIPKFTVSGVEACAVIQIGWPLAVTSVDSLDASYAVAPHATWAPIHWASLAIDLLIVSSTVGVLAIGVRAARQTCQRGLSLRLVDLLLLIALVAVPLSIAVASHRGHLRDERLWERIETEDSSQTDGGWVPMLSRTTVPGDFLRLRWLLPTDWFDGFTRVMSLQLSPDSLKYAPHFDRLTMLCILDVDPDELHHLRRCQSLQALNIYCHNRLDNDGMAKATLTQLAQLTQLRSLKIFSGTVTPPAATSISQLQGLEGLYLMNCDMNNEGVARLSNLKRLRHLAIDGPTITDLAIPTLSDFRCLESLLIGESQITLVGLESLDSLERLRELYLVDLPIPLGQLWHLAALPALSRVWLGQVPPEEVEDLRARRPNMNVQVQHE